MRSTQVVEFGKVTCRGVVNATNGVSTPFITLSDVYRIDHIGMRTLTGGGM